MQFSNNCSAKCTFEVNNPETRVVVIEDDAYMTLYCNVSSKLRPEYRNWKTCEWKWHNGSSEGECKFIYQQNENIMEVKKDYCTGRLYDLQRGERELRFDGSPALTLLEPKSENFECRLIISKVELSDAGFYSCTLTQCKRIEHGGCSHLAGSGITANATRLVRVCVFIFQPCKAP